MSQKVRVWLGIGIVVGGYLAIRTSFNIIRLYKAGGRVKEAEERLVALSKKKTELEAKIAESESADFVERQAREKLGMGKEGEVVVIVDDREKSNIQNSKFNDNVPNWKKWRKLYLGF